jgi:hypothetical protein
MGIMIRKHGTVIAQFASAQQVDISHVNDSIALGDGSSLISAETVGAQKALIVKPVGGGDASAANQTSGGQKTQVVDAGGVVAEIDDVAGEKAIKVSVISTVGGGAAPAHTDDAAFAVGVDQLTPIGAMFDDTATDSVNEGDVGVLRMTADRILLTQIQSSALPTGAASAANQTTIIGHLDGVEGLLTTIDADTGALAACVGGTELQVDIVSSALPSGASTSANQTTIIGHLDGVEGLLTTIDADTGNLAAILTSLQLIDDGVATVAAAITTKGMAAVGTDGTNARILKTDTSGELQIDVLSIAAGTNNIGDVDIASIAAGDNNIGNVDIVTMPGVAGVAAHDAAVSGNPVRVAGRAMLANGTATAEDDTTDIATDNQGRVLVTPLVPRNLVTQATGSQATTTEATMLAAGGAGVFHDVTKLILTNVNTTTAARVQIRDTTAGTIIMEVNLAANGGAVIDFSGCPLCQTTANTNWTIDMAAAVSTVYWYIQAVKRIA